MRNYTLAIFLGLLFSATLSNAQSTPTWADDIGPLMYESCTRCHQPNGVGPFSITSFQDAYDNRFMIRSNVVSGVMPPWPPDPDYQHFALERALTDTEVDLIDQWVLNGAPRGDSTQEPAAPWYPDVILGPGDSKMQIAPYTSQAQSQDEYVCFALDPGISVDKVIRALEVVPGNRSAVHHVLVHVVDANAGYTPGQVYPGCTDPGGRLLGGYAPGGGPQQFPDVSTQMGITIEPDQVIVLAMHYPEGTFGQVDSTYLNLHFYPDGTNNIREVSAGPVFESWNFVLLPDQESTVAQWYPQFGVLNQDISILSIFPHNHLLGKSWLVYGVDANLDTIPLISIPSWDFDWQGFYIFDFIKKIPQYSRLYCEAVYDNTTANPFNPNSPPQTVIPGLNTTDEMFLCYMHYLLYEPGDELINMGALVSAPVAVAPRNDDAPLGVHAFPNPFNKFTTVEYEVATKAQVEVQVFDLQGKMVRKIWQGTQGKGTFRVIWNGNDSTGQEVAAGNYIARVKVGDQVQNIRLLKVK